MKNIMRIKLNEMEYKDKFPEIIERREKISIKIFEEIFERKEFTSDKLLLYEFNANQLKNLNKNFLLKISGNKLQLLSRVYNYKFYLEKNIIIKRCWKNYLLKKYNNLLGPAYIKRHLCTNEIDFFTLEKCNKIPYLRFISFKDEENFIYGFDIISIYNLFVNNKYDVTNPFTNKKLSNTLFNNIKRIIKLNKYLNIDINLEVKKENLSKKEKIRMKAIKICHEIDLLNNYTQINWILDLDNSLLIRYIAELHDIWIYRAKLDDNSRKLICPPHGNPFKIINFNYINELYQMQNDNLIEIVLEIIQEFVLKGREKENRILGTYYVLAALTLVSKSAALAMPWLFESIN